MMSEMVDRIARVIESEDDRISLFTAERLAIAVIAAMREPTSKMLKAAQATNNDYTPDKWAAMIDAALK